MKLIQVFILVLLAGAFLSCDGETDEEDRSEQYLNQIEIKLKSIQFHLESARQLNQECKNWIIMSDNETAKLPVISYIQKGIDIELLFESFKLSMIEELQYQVGGDYLQYNQTEIYSIESIEFRKNSFQNNEVYGPFAKDGAMTDDGDDVLNILYSFKADLLGLINDPEIKDYQDHIAVIKTLVEEIEAYYDWTDLTITKTQDFNKFEVALFILGIIEKGAELSKLTLRHFMEVGRSYRSWNTFDAYEAVVVPKTENIKEGETMVLSAVISMYDSKNSSRVRYWIDDSTHSEESMKTSEYPLIEIPNMKKGEHRVDMSILLYHKDFGKPWMMKWVGIEPYYFTVN